MNDRRKIGIASGVAILAVFAIAHETGILEASPASPRLFTESNSDGHDVLVQSHIYWDIEKPQLDQTGKTLIILMGS